MEGGVGAEAVSVAPVITADVEMERERDMTSPSAARVGGAVASEMSEGMEVRGSPSAAACSGEP